MKNLLIVMALSGILAWDVCLSEGAALPGPLVQVIEGAKKEGTVSAKLASGFTQKSMSRLEREVKERYGVGVKIKFSPVLKMTNELAQAMMEYKAGVPPTYDLLTLGGHVAEGMRAGVFERVDWKPLLTEDMNPDVLHGSPLMRGGIIYHTGHFGLMYNSEKVKAGEVPKTMGDLANPKWRGKGGIEGTTNSMLRWAFILGKESVFSHIRAILKNEAIQGRYVDLLNRFLLGEIAWCTINSAMLMDAQDKGMPAAWQSLDFSDIQDYSLVLVKGSKQPNAAKLISLYLASPAGARFLTEEAKGGTLYYPGNYEHEIRLQDQKQGIREIFTTKEEKILEFYDSKEAAQWEKELSIILQTGGGH